MNPVDLRLTFTGEGFIFELATVVIYIFALITCIGVYRRTKDRVTRFMAMLIGGISLMWTLEETSFGRDIVYRYDRWELYGIKLDSVHDLLNVLKSMLEVDPTKGTTLLTFGILGLIGLIVLGWCLKNIATVKSLMENTSFFFVVVSTVLLVVAGIVDLEIIGDNQTIFVLAEEMMEFSAAVAISFAAYALFHDNFTIAKK